VSPWLLLAAVLAVALIVCLVQLVRTRRALAAARAEVTALESRIRPVPQHPALEAAGRAVRQVSRTAARVRDHGVLQGLLVSSIEDLTRWATEERTEIVRYAADDGTVTFFFSDIVDSTASNEELGDPAWVKLLAAHDRLVRSALARHGGHVVKTQGDGFMAVFGDPTAAVRSALAIQRALGASRSVRLRRTPVAVRIGLHSGVAIERDGDFLGRNVAMAARVAARADGGEVLVSDELRTALGDDFTVTDAGTTTLKGLAGEHRLWAVRA
jgi:class 3 adenylate cyclase